jgi:hypothetical protein
MKRRHVTMAFLVYVTLDLSSPFVPGSFNFDPDECVEGIQRASSPDDLAVSAVPSGLPVVGSVVPAPSPVRPGAGGRHPVLERLVDSRADTRAAGDPPPPGEDH